MSSATSTFEAALDGIGVGATRTDAAGFADALSEVVEAPAVGTALPFEGVSLADSDVVVDPTPGQLADARTGVTPASFAVADLGSVAVRSRAAGDEPVSLYPPRHVAVVAESDVLPDLPAAFDRLARTFEAGRDSLVFATGASATADMGAMVEGVHGPSEVHVVVVTDR
jgi:L-lactate dehydrogenase complex protein LldG